MSSKKIERHSTQPFTMQKQEEKTVGREGENDEATKGISTSSPKKKSSSATHHRAPSPNDDTATTRNAIARDSANDLKPATAGGGGRRRKGPSKLMNALVAASLNNSNQDGSISQPVTHTSSSPALDVEGSTILERRESSSGMGSSPSSSRPQSRLSSGVRGPQPTKFEKATRKAGSAPPLHYSSTSTTTKDKNRISPSTVAMMAQLANAEELYKNETEDEEDDEETKYKTQKKQKGAGGGGHYEYQHDHINDDTDEEQNFRLSSSELTQVYSNHSSPLKTDISSQLDLGSGPKLSVKQLSGGGRKNNKQRMGSPVVGHYDTPEEEGTNESSPFQKSPTHKSIALKKALQEEEEKEKETGHTHINNDPQGTEFHDMILFVEKSRDLLVREWIHEGYEKLSQWQQLFLYRNERQKAFEKSKEMLREIEERRKQREKWCVQAMMTVSTSHHGASASKDFSSELPAEFPESLQDLDRQDRLALMLSPIAAKNQQALMSYISSVAGSSKGGGYNMVLSPTTTTVTMSPSPGENAAVGENNAPLSSFSLPTNTVGVHESSCSTSAPAVNMENSLLSMQPTQAPHPQEKTAPTQGLMTPTSLSTTPPKPHSEAFILTIEDQTVILNILAEAMDGSHLLNLTPAVKKIRQELQYLHSFMPLRVTPLFFKHVFASFYNFLLQESAAEGSHSEAAEHRPFEGWYHSGSNPSNVTAATVPLCFQVATLDWIEEICASGKAYTMFQHQPVQSFDQVLIRVFNDLMLVSEEYMTTHKKLIFLHRQKRQKELEDSQKPKQPSLMKSSSGSARNLKQREEEAADRIREKLSQKIFHEKQKLELSFYCFLTIFSTILREMQSFQTTGAAATIKVSNTCDAVISQQGGGKSVQSRVVNESLDDTRSLFHPSYKVFIESQPTVCVPQVPSPAIAKFVRAGRIRTITAILERRQHLQKIMRKQQMSLEAESRRNLLHQLGGHVPEESVYDIILKEKGLKQVELSSLLSRTKSDPKKHYPSPHRMNKNTSASDSPKGGQKDSGEAQRQSAATKSVLQKIQQAEIPRVDSRTKTPYDLLVESFAKKPQSGLQEDGNTTRTTPGMPAVNPLQLLLFIREKRLPLEEVFRYRIQENARQLEMEFESHGVNAKEAMREYLQPIEGYQEEPPAAKTPPLRHTPPGGNKNLCPLFEAEEAESKIIPFRLDASSDEGSKLIQTEQRPKNNATKANKKITTTANLDEGPSSILELIHASKAVESSQKYLKGQQDSSRRTTLRFGSDNKLHWTGALSPKSPTEDISAIAPSASSWFKNIKNQKTTQHGKSKEEFEEEKNRSRRPATSLSEILPDRERALLGAPAGKRSSAAASFHLSEIRWEELKKKQRRTEDQREQVEARKKAAMLAHLPASLRMYYYY